MFIRELSTNDDNIIRNNIILILCDLCRKFTSNIDIFINDISLYMCDSDIMVRKHTIISLTGLLLEDYIKLKNVMLYSYLICLVDEDEFIKKYTEINLQQIYQKFPNSICNQFIELICVLNNFKGLTITSQISDKALNILSKYQGNSPENQAY